MKVEDLIEWLQTKDPHATVVIHDADTDMFLPLKIGAKPAAATYTFVDMEPLERTVAVHCEYP